MKKAAKLRSVSARVSVGPGHAFRSAGRLYTVRGDRKTNDMTEPVAGGAMALAKAVQSSGRRPSRDPRTTRPQRETFFGFRQLIRGLQLFPYEASRLG